MKNITQYLALDVATACMNATNTTITWFILHGNKDKNKVRDVKEKKAEKEVKQ